jgi:hypothetical protein
MTTSTVKHNECEDHREKIFEKVNENTKSINQFKGGFWVAKYLVPTLIALAITIGTIKLSSMNARMTRILNHLRINEGPIAAMPKENRTP